jgi:hypothetical protein
MSKNATCKKSRENIYILRLLAFFTAYTYNSRWNLIEIDIQAQSKRDIIIDVEA